MNMEWIVVWAAGTSRETVWSEHETFLGALVEFERCGESEEGFDVMRRLPDGTMTTEY